MLDTNQDASMKVAPDPAFWDRAAEKYARRPVQDMAAYERTLERARAHLTPSDKVLEIGCGTGTTALKLADAAGSILATDLSGAMIDIAERKRREAGVENLRFRQATAFDASLDAGGFDAVLAFNLLHLVEDVPATARRARELLRPGGLFISKTACLGARAWLFGPLIGVMRLIGKAPRVTMLREEELEEILRAAGFELVEADNHSASPPCRFIVARRL